MERGLLLPIRATNLVIVIRSLDLSSASHCAFGRIEWSALVPSVWLLSVCDWIVSTYHSRDLKITGLLPPLLLSTVEIPTKFPWLWLRRIRAPAKQQLVGALLQLDLPSSRTLTFLRKQRLNSTSADHLNFKFWSSLAARLSCDFPRKFRSSARPNIFLKNFQLHNSGTKKDSKFKATILARSK